MIFYILSCMLIQDIVRNSALPRSGTNKRWGK